MRNFSNGHLLLIADLEIILDYSSLLLAEKMVNTAMVSVPGKLVKWTDPKRYDQTDMLTEIGGKNPNNKRKLIIIRPVRCSAFQNTSDFSFSTFSQKPTYYESRKFIPAILRTEIQSYLC